jgi:UNC-6/NTR/C345C module
MIAPTLTRMFAFVAVLLLAAHQTRACRCLPDALDPFKCADKDLVVLGKVLSKINTQCSEGSEKVLYPVHVLDVIKNTTGEKIKKGTLLWVNTRVSSASCGLVLEPGSSYILYPDVDEGSLGLKLGSDLCLTSGLLGSSCRPTVGPGPTRRQIREVKRAC